MAVAQAKIAAILDCPIQKDTRNEIAPLSTMAAGKTEKNLALGCSNYACTAG